MQFGMKKWDPVAYCSSLRMQSGVELVTYKIHGLRKL